MPSSPPLPFDSAPAGAMRLASALSEAVLLESGWSLDELLALKRDLRGIEVVPTEEGTSIQLAWGNEPDAETLERLSKSVPIIIMALSGRTEPDIV